MKAGWSIDEIQEIWRLATKMHDGQKYGGAEDGVHVEYLNHIGSVTFEILNALVHEEQADALLAVKCAMLHDTIEDTEMSYEALRDRFGPAVANGVLALTKDTRIEGKQAQMLDSLERIKQQPHAIWAVKMADRIVNLTAPPYYWNDEKKRRYLEEARLIHHSLKAGNTYLAKRLSAKIDAYNRFLD